MKIQNMVKGVPQGGSNPLPVSCPVPPPADGEPQRSAIDPEPILPGSATLPDLPPAVPAAPLPVSRLTLPPSLPDPLQVSSLIPPPSPPAHLQVSGHTLPPSPAPPPPAFPRCPGETPRAFSAFLAFYQLGHGRSLLAVAELLGERHDTVRAWASKYRWSERINSFNAGLLEQQAEAEATARRQQAADWSRRTNEYREQEWDAAQKLLAAAQCYLESFGDQAVEKMTLAQVSRALQISSSMARQALSGTHAPDAPASTPIQDELLAALKKAYGPPQPSPHTN